MKKVFKRIIASLLVAVMLFGSAPLEALTGIDFNSPIDVEASAAGSSYKTFFPLAYNGNPYYVTVLGRYSYGGTHKSYINQYVLGINNYSYSNSIMDISAPEGTTIYAVADGKVHTNRYAKNGGNYLVISHDDGSYSYYGHMKWLSTLKVGQKVKSGDIIGYVGTTGASTGFHLHFEWSGYDAYCMYKKLGYVIIANSSGASKYPHTHAPNDYNTPDIYLPSVKMKTEPCYFALNKLDGAPIRSAPENKAETIKKRLNPGDKMIVLGTMTHEDGSFWYYVEYTDPNTGEITKGYMFNKNITKTKTKIPVASVSMKYLNKDGASCDLDNRLHKKGEKFFVTGTFNSRYSTIKRIDGATMKYNTETNAYDKMVCDTTVYPNASSFTITKGNGKSNFNYNLVFAGLDAGHYKFVVTVSTNIGEMIADTAYFEVSSSVSASKNNAATMPKVVKSASLFSDYGKYVLKNFKDTVTELLEYIKNYKPPVVVPPVVPSVVPPVNPDDNKPEPVVPDEQYDYKLGVYRTTTSDNLNIRKGPGSNHAKVTNAIPKGTEIEIAEVSSNGWGKTVYNGYTGWVSLKYCTYLRPFETIKKPAAPSVTLGTDINLPAGAIVSASWSDVEHADSYTAYLKNSSGATVKTSSEIRGNSVSFTADKAGTYYITVCAVNSKYTSAESAATRSFNIHAPLTVSFVDWDGRTETRTVAYGSAAIAPDPPSREGYTFTGWDTAYNKVYSNLTVKATYKINSYYVKFVDYNGKPLGVTQKITYGSSAAEPQEKNVPTGYEFIGWSSDAWKSVKSNLTINAVYKWGNEDLPAVVTDVKADYISGGYNVSFKITCKNAVTNGRAVVAIKTTEGKLVSTTESAAFSLPSNTSGKVIEVYTPADSPASVAEVYIVKSFVNAIPISEAKTCTIDLHDQWSEWSTVKPDNNLYTNIEERTEYRYRDKEFTTATSKTKSGWTLYNTTSTSSSGSQYSYIGSVTSDSHVRTVTTKEETTYETWYRYTHYTNGGIKVPGTTNYTTWVCAHEKGNTADGCGPTNIGPHTYETKTRLSKSSSTVCSAGKYGPVNCSAHVSERGKTCINTWWFNEKAFQKPVETKIKYSYTDTYYTYYFYRWKSWSGWSTSATTANSNRQVETRKVYRYKNEGFVAAENTAGTVRTVSGNVGAKYAGEQATIFIYKINEASDWTGQFVGQTVIASDGSYSFTFKLREEPTVETGDFTISLGIEGCSSVIKVGTIEAPKPEYKVTFYDHDGSIWNQQTVVEGGTATVPENPEREGYIFAGWDSTLTNIGGDVELNARYIQKEYTVVFVDWTNKVVLTKNFMHGEFLAPPEVAEVEGYDITGWENVIVGETVVTGNMVVTAEYAKKTYEVNFYDFDGNVISTQTVGYGEEPEGIDVPEKDNYLFDGWESGDNNVDNKDGVINFYPTFIFDETVENPVSSLANGTYSTAQTVELTCPTETAVIYYTLDGSDPVGNGIEYTGPITIDRSAELKFYAEAFEMNESEVTTNYYAVNTGNTVSKWMLESEIPEYVKNDNDTYVTESTAGYQYKDVTVTSNYSDILSLENEGWTNEGFEYGEWSSWFITEPTLEGIACEIETQEPPAEEEIRYSYTRYKYLDAQTGEYKYSPTVVEGVDCMLEKHLSAEKLSVAGYVAGTEIKYYLFNGEEWYNQGFETVDVIPDYLMYRYRTKDYTLTKWTDWTVEAPAEGETRETETNTVYRYSIPEMYIVNIVPDYSTFGTETITFIAEANKLIGIDAADYEYEGYDFIGFFTDKEFTQYWNHETQTVSGNLTLYPKYKVNTYSVIFVDYDSTVLAEETVDYGAFAYGPETVERDGYVFIGWDTEDINNVTENLIVTAQYVDEDEYCRVTLDHGKYNLITGTSFTLKATLTPADTENANVDWYSDNTDVAIVNDEGIVTAVGQGMATIIAVAEATGEIDECVITISANPSEEMCLIAGSNLRIDAENNLLRNIRNSDSTVASVKSQFVNTDLVFTDINGNELSDDDIIGTGTVVKFVDGENVIDKVTAVVIGDMNGDGYVNNRDASMITRYLVEKETADFVQMVAIDVNGDGYVNNRDASMVSRYLVGKEKL